MLNGLHKIHQSIASYSLHQLVSYSGMSKYPLVDRAARHVWSKDGQEVFRDFCAKHASSFIGAPAVEIEGEQNLEFYDLFQRYLRLYENQMSDFIDSLGSSDRAFYEQLQDVQDDTELKDKKLKKFVDYLVACTDYPAFYKLMVRAAKKLSTADSKSDAPIGLGDAKGGSSAGSKAEGKYAGDEPGEKSHK